MSGSSGMDQSSASEERGSGDIKQNAHTRAGAPLQFIRPPIKGIPTSDSTPSKLRSPSPPLCLQTLPFSLQSMPSPGSTRSRESPRLTLITRQLITGSKIPSILTGGSSPTQSRADSTAQGSGSQLMSSIPMHSPDSSKAASCVNSPQLQRAKSSETSAVSINPAQRARSRTAPSAAAGLKHSASQQQSKAQVNASVKASSAREASRSRERRRGGQFTTVRYVHFVLLGCSSGSHVHADTTQVNEPMFSFFLYSILNC